VFIDEPTPEHVLDGLDRLAAIGLAQAGLLADARRFDEQTFISRIRGVVTKVLEERPSSTPVDLSRGQVADPLSRQP